MTDSLLICHILYFQFGFCSTNSPGVRTPHPIVSASNVRSGHPHRAGQRFFAIQQHFRSPTSFACSGNSIDVLQRFLPATRLRDSLSSSSSSKVTPIQVQIVSQQQASASAGYRDVCGYSSSTPERRGLANCDRLLCRLFVARTVRN